ncbi:phosphoglycerate mutase-like protein [Hygrophoropsis aurantiaca]|uniref:Phosphoglycerate mutase-like protein n=1 Tax=Hygrophoropsis aurantiaca TaxID=72124 RepID=A0ACB8AJZ7_9AGAM|nr:phosphoglycerate mutase-like protein [Hygrophoropsis aurantiaca]
MYIPAFFKVFPMCQVILQSSQNPNDPKNTLGNLSPYHVASTVSGIQKDLPSDCSVEQVILMHQHGSRGPLDDAFSLMQGLYHLFDNSSDIVQLSDLPPQLKFLEDIPKREFALGELTPVGRQQLFSHGVDFLSRYPYLTTNMILAGNQSRDIESSRWFAQGYFGHDALNVSFVALPDSGTEPSWIRPWLSCPRWQDFGDAEALKWVEIYVPHIISRLNGVISGLDLTDDHVRGALYACAYELAAYDRSPWCGLFSPEELLQFEYELDVYTVNSFGHNLPDNMGPIMGAVYVKKLIERLTNSTGDAKPLYLEFGHDVTIYLALTALGLAKDSSNPSDDDTIRSDRQLRTSYQAPFAANMVWEKFTCSKSFEGSQVRLVLNEATFPLTICARTDDDKSYGTCSLGAFVAANQRSTDIELGDKRWNDACGPV